jgi:hypothetical protein
MSDEEDRLYEEYGEQMPRPMPESWTDLQAKFEERGEQMPHFRQQDRLRAWRDYLEHWDEPARGVKGPGARAGARSRTKRNRACRTAGPPTRSPDLACEH